MSCGLRDVANLEAGGRPCVLVHTEAFCETAPGQAEMLGQPAMRRVVVPHPVQDKSEERIRELAETALPGVLGALVA